MVSLMIQNRFAFALASSVAFGLAACGGGSAGSGTSGSAAAMNLSVVSNGFGQLLPHTTTLLVNDAPSATIIELRSFDDLISNVRANNPVLPGPLYPAGSILPTGEPGNQFMYARFTQELDINSVLDSSPGGQAAQGLTGAISVVALDPATGETSPVVGRAFIGGQTYSGIVVGSPPALPLQTWVELDGNGKPVAADVNGDTPGLGFPGTQGDFGGSADLVSPNSFVFVVDSDGDLSTHESFPTGRQIRMRISNAVRGSGGAGLIDRALASTLVGTDTIAPEVLVAPPPFMTPQISPGNGDQDVDPMTEIRVEFSEPIQPLSLGDLPTGSPPNLSAALQIMFGPSTSQTEVPFTILPESIFDLSTYKLTPVFAFPGEGPPAQSCGVFNRVDVFANTGQFMDLSNNMNSLPANTFFVTGEGPGIVNAPVAPETIFVGFSGANPGIGVIDLNGFGQTTGNPSFSPTSAVLIEGETNFPNNPNVRFQGALMRPALTQGSCTFDGGSAGIFRLTLDSSLESLLVRAPIALTINDMMLGHALDATFNNGPSPFGCQSGGQNVGGNLCAQGGLKMIQAIQTGLNTIGPPINNSTIILQTQGENLISWAPHPNPPSLIFPPPCVQPFLGGQEPTSLDTINGAGLSNLLVPSTSPFGQPQLGIPPSGLLSPEQNTWFYGPSLPQAQVSACANYFIRQQIGHFLYVLDRGRRELIIFNSNRMTVVDRILLPDPTQLAMSPNLDTLAISNQDTDSVTFIDIDPTSATFHTVVNTAIVGRRPSGIAWEPGNEDILVANEGDSTVTVISAFSLQPRNTVSSNLNEPFDIAITPRQSNFGFARNVYFAYIMNRNGRVAFFESGPNEVGGWGFDDIVGVAPATFNSPQAIQPDPVNTNSAVWIAHTGPIDLKTETPGNLTEGAVSRVGIVSGFAGQVALGGISFIIPNIRDLVLGVTVSIGETELSGRPVDIAFDNMRNYGGLTNVITTFSAGTPVQSNGKGLVRVVANQVVNTSEPKYMFAAVPFPLFGEGRIDVLAIDGSNSLVDVNAFQAGNQSIPAIGVSVLMDYFRQ